MVDKENDYGHLVGKSLQYSAFQHAERMNCKHSPDECGLSEITSSVLGDPLVRCRVSVETDDGGLVDVIDDRDGQVAKMPDRGAYCARENWAGFQIVDLRWVRKEN